MCLLNEKMSINWKGTYWTKMCLLIENVLIDRKCTYWSKMYILNEKVPIDRKVLIKWKCVYWMKMCLLTKSVPIEWKRCLLKGHNSLGINSDLYSFGNFFSTSYLSSFLERQETCAFSLKLLFVNWFFFFFLVK